jgi:hypothetical protein
VMQVCLRRLSPFAVRPGEGPLLEPTAGVQPVRREPLFMPHYGPLPAVAQPAQLGRVGMWRGGGRPGMSVSAPFV